MANKTIKVDYIARVEGESSLDLRVRNGAVEAVHLSIFEPPRFFEGLCRADRQCSNGDAAGTST